GGAVECQSLPVWLRPCCKGCFSFFFFQAEDGIRDKLVTGVQTCALPISCFCRRIYFFAFSAQKSHVKPQRPLKPTASSTYPWHVYPLQPRIIKLASKTTRHVLSHLKSIVCEIGRASCRERVYMWE